MQVSQAIATIRRSIRSLVQRMFGVQPLEYEFDHTQGIPIINYGTRSGVYIGRRANPLHVALFACRQLGLESVTGPIMLPHIKETETPQYVQRAVNWLTSNERRFERFSVWEYDFHWPSYGATELQPPWRCALAEAYGALVLLVTGKTEQARRHLESMLIDYRCGGVAYIDNGRSWALEYVCDKVPLVLNGMLHCLLVLHESALRLDDPHLRDAFRVGFDTVKADLGIFDAGFYTFYDSRRNPADQKYHQLHVALLRMLYMRTKDRYLLPWLQRWSRFERMYPIVEPVIFAKLVIDSRGTLRL